VKCRCGDPPNLICWHFHGTLCMCMLPHLRSALSDVMRTPIWPHGAWHHVKLLCRRGWDVREGRKLVKVENSAVMKINAGALRAGKRNNEGCGDAAQ
jgi:hypothetical protein